MEKTEAIIFDLGGVILNIDYHLTQKAFEDIGVTDFNHMYSQANADKLFSNLEKGKISETEFYRLLNERTGLQLSHAQIRNAWNAMLLDFREDSLAFINSIKKKYRLFLLSNTNAIHYNKFCEIYLEKERFSSFESFFEKAWYSFEMGLRKPEDDCYESVLSKNGLNPQRTLFIDDSIQNVDTAARLGLRTVWLKPGMLIENLGL
ncbi:MAG: HAD family phosphatase [Ginsengibacter sp.]